MTLIEIVHDIASVAALLFVLFVVLPWIGKHFT